MFRMNQVPTCIRKLKIEECVCVVIVSVSWCLSNSAKPLYELSKVRRVATPRCYSQQQIWCMERHMHSDGSFTFTMFGMLEDKRPLNSSVFSVGLLSAEAEWNWLTRVLMAFSNSEY